MAADNTCTEAIIRDTREFNIYTRRRESLFRVKREICINVFFQRCIESTFDINISRVLPFLDIIFKSKREIYIEYKLVA